MKWFATTVRASTNRCVALLMRAPTAAPTVTITTRATLTGTFVPVYQDMSKDYRIPLQHSKCRFHNAISKKHLNFVVMWKVR